MNFKVDESWRGLCVAALDISTKSTGWALYQFDEFQKTGTFQSTKEFYMDRIKEMGHIASAFSVEYSPDIVIFEDGFPDRDDQRRGNVSLKLAEARGAILSRIGGVSYRISNSSWKLGIGLTTRDSLDKSVVKEIVWQKACHLWERDLPVTLYQNRATHDESDAAAILAHSLMNLKYEG